MTKNDIKISIKKLSLVLVLSIVIGSLSALFLVSLDAVLLLKSQFPFLLYFLPLAGFFIGYMYHQFGNGFVKGNKLILQSIKNEHGESIPILMFPFIWLSTLLTHLFGGSAGREGTAVQIAGSVADQIGRLFQVNDNQRKSILIASISAGFAAVFGTPLAGIVFSIELNGRGALRLNNLLLCTFLAFLSHFTVVAWGVSHTHYIVNQFPSIGFTTVGLVIISAIIFGFCANFYLELATQSTYLFNKFISYPPFRPLLGGIVVLLLVYFFHLEEFTGLGISTISSSFYNQSEFTFFIIKIALTVITLSSGFKGGEVTPLFFIGATLGSALSFFIPLPIGFMAAIGFIAVFAGASKTPIASAIMGVELFGLQGIVFYFIATFVSYFFSGKKGIYRG